MRVDTGIILSVLSFSVLAAVIPNYDDHGILLARRTVDPDTMDLLWKRADEDQEESEPSGSGADTSAGTSGNSQPSKKGGTFRSFMKSRNARKQKSAQESDIRYVDIAIRKLTKVAEGRNKNAFILKTGSFLNSAIEMARKIFNLYADEATAPFLLSIAEGPSKKSLTKEMAKIQKAGRRAADKNLKAVIRAIFLIIRRPRGVEVALEKITTSILSMYRTHQGLYEKEYTNLISKVEPANNEAYIKKTQDFMSSMKKHQEHMLGSAHSMQMEIGNKGVTFKQKKPSRFKKFKLGAKSRLGPKSKSPTDVTSDQDTTEVPQEISV